MRFIFPLLSIAAFFIPFPAYGQDWIWHKMDDGKISVLVPGNMEYQQRDIETAVGTITQHHYFHRDSTSATGNYLYHVSYYDYPEGTFPADSTGLRELMMQMIIEGSVRDLGGELQYEGDLLVTGNQAKLWKVFVGEGNYFVKNLLVMEGDRILNMQVFTRAENDKNAQADKFLDSLRLTG